MKKFAKPVIGLLALLMILGVGSTLAFLIDSDGPVENIFTPSRVTSEVVETFDETNQIKRDVKIRNTGDTDAYIRAAIVVTWKDKDGNVLGQMPTEEEYNMSLKLNESQSEYGDGEWEKNGNYYYWSNPVKAGETTGILIESCTTTKNIKIGDTTYNLNVEIICSAIQAGPEGAVNAWKGVNLDE